MERPTFKPIGTPSDELDTPALVVDLGALESNIALIHAAVEAAGARIRNRAWTPTCALQSDTFRSERVAPMVSRFLPLGRQRYLDNTASATFSLPISW